MKAFASVIAAAVCVVLSVSPAAAEYLFYRNSSVLADHQRFGVPLSRLDRNDLAHEFAREAEHARIRSRLGDPDHVCHAAVVDGTLDVVVIVCRSFGRPW